MVFNLSPALYTAHLAENGKANIEDGGIGPG
jgi:hypothetical protein